MPRSSLGIVAAMALAAALGAPAFAAPAVEATGHVRDVRGFDQVENATRGDVVLTQGSTESLEIVAAPADLARITTVVQEGVLRIGTVGPADALRGPVTYMITMRNITGLTTNSSGSIHADGVRTDGVKITVHSSGSVEIASLSARTLEVLITSSGNVSLGGSVDRQAVRSSSSGEYRAAGLACREASVALTSSGRATIRVSGLLEGRISSSGNLRFHGTPPRVDVSATSSGRLVKLD